MENNDMSTKIDDLPIPDFNEPKREVVKEPVRQQIQKTNEIVEKSTTLETEKFSVLKAIKREINEENLFLLVLFLILSISDTNKYISSIPYIGSYYGEESWSFIVFKSVLFLLVFIIGKTYLLPKIQI